VIWRFCYFCENTVLPRTEEKQQKALSVKLKSTVKENESFSKQNRQMGLKTGKISSI
jgi:hypothetical protein